MLLLAAADRAAGLLELLQPLMVEVMLLLLLLLERMRMLRMESQMVPVPEQRQLDHGGAVRARLPRRAPALEGLQAAARTPLLAEHLRGAGPFIRGLHLSLHHPDPGDTAPRLGCEVGVFFLFCFFVFFFL